MDTWDEKTNYPFAQLKYDGHFLHVSKTEAGTVKAVSRIGSDLTEKVKYALGRVYAGLPCGVRLAGELYLPGGDSSTVKTAIKEASRELRFVGFAILNEGLEQTGLFEIAGKLAAWGIPYAEFVTFGPDVPAETLLAYATKLEKTSPPEIEGVVFKRGNTWDVAKWKPQKTIDLIICGYEDGQGKYLGQVGNIILKTCEGYEVAKASGFDDLTRLEISCNRKKYLGAVVEVEYQKVLSKGRLRHPRFKRFREDKLAENCPAYQDSELSKYWDK
jgi:ATP-dependent DNA ligase